jgi:hypothetical protein
MGGFAARSKICATIMSGLSLEVLIVFIILKLDGFTQLNHLDWIKLIVIPFVIGASFVILWMLIHFFTEGAENVSKGLLLQPQELLMDQEVVDPTSVDGFNQFHVFRDILLFSLYCLFIVYGVAIYVTPCQSCTTPYAMLSLGIVLTYSVRALLLLYHFHQYYRRYTMMVTEISNYRTLHDENRLFNEALPDLHATDENNYSYVLDVAMFLLTLSLALFGTVWVQNNECAVRCVKLFHYNKYLLAGMYVFEAGYVVSVLLIRFYERMSGVETIQTLFNRLKNQTSTSKNVNKGHGNADKLHPNI